MVAFKGRYMRISAKNINEYSWYLRPLFQLQRRKYGAVLNSSLLWARVPRIFLGISALYGGIDRKTSPISSGLRSLIIVRVSQLNGCEFCVDLNSSLLLKRGVEATKLTALSHWKESALFNEQERIVLEYAEAMTLSHLRVEDRLMKRLKALFRDDEIIELTAIVAYQNMSTKFNTALGVPAQGFCAVRE